MEYQYEGDEPVPVAPTRNFRASGNLHKTEMPINQFGHTVTNPDAKNVTPIEKMQIGLDGLGNPVASGDIFDSPHLQKFMKQHGFEIGAQVAPPEIELDEEEVFEPAVPLDLEAFEAMADSLLATPPKARFATARRYVPENIIEDRPIATRAPIEARAAQPAPENGCVDCAAPISPGVKFCTMCGSKQPTRFCGGCGHKFIESERFCPHCGLPR